MDTISEIKEKELYRHFKGNYYWIMDIIAKDDGSKTVQYVGLYPPFENYERPLEEFYASIEGRTDNATGQNNRFEEEPKILNKTIMIKDYTKKNEE